MKKYIICFLLLAVVLSLAGCAKVLETEKGTEIKIYCEEIVEAILHNDPNTAVQAFADGVNEEEISKFVSRTKEYIGPVSTYSLTQKGWRTGTNNGSSYYEATFEMVSDNGTFYITGTTAEGYDRLYNFNIVSAEESGLVFTGTLSTLAGANGMQWGVLALAAVFAVFMILMFIDCCKNKIRYKGLWLVLILCGAFVINISDSNIGFRFAVMLMQYSHLKIYPTGVYELNLVLPLGAILYAVFRKGLLIKEPQIIREETPEDCAPFAPADPLPSHEQNTEPEE